MDVADEVAQHVHRVDPGRAAVVPTVLRPRHPEVRAGQEEFIKIQKPCSFIHTVPTIKQDAATSKR